MSCLYAEQSVEKCQCSCKGISHGMAVEKQVVKCTPSARVACMTGEGKVEDCTCACGTANHGVMKEIKNFDEVKINNPYEVE